MTLPAWIRPLGLAQHLVAGGVLAALLAGLGTPAAARVVAVAAVGIAHELGDGDFTKAEGAPGTASSTCWRFCPYRWCGGFCDRGARAIPSQQ